MDTASKPQTAQEFWPKSVWVDKIRGVLTMQCTRCTTWGPPIQGGTIDFLAKRAHAFDRGHKCKPL